MHECAEIFPGLWTLEGDPVRFLGFPYALRMAAARLPDGGLFVHSPVQMTPTRRAAVDRLGPVRHIVSPNKLHHLHLAAWAAAYPKARLYAPPGLARKRRDLTFAAALTDTPEPAWAEVFRQCVVRGSFFMQEVLFFHIASATVIVGDLIENHDVRAFSSAQRAVARLNHMAAPSGETPINYRLSFWDRRSAREALQRVLSWRPKRVVVMHGPCVFENADGFLKNAFAWALS